MAYNNHNLLLTVLETEKSKMSVSEEFMSGDSLLPGSNSFFLWVLTCRRREELAGVPFIIPSLPNLFLRAPPSNTITLEIIF